MHTRRVGRPVTLWIDTLAKGGVGGVSGHKKVKKNGAIWCILSVPKCVITSYSHINCIVARCLIHVVYLYACAFIMS